MRRAFACDRGLAELAPPSMMWVDIECRSDEVAFRTVTRTRHLWRRRLFQLQRSLQTGDRRAKGTARRDSFHPSTRSKPARISGSGETKTGRQIGRGAKRPDHVHSKIS